MGNDIESDISVEARKKSELLLEHPSAQFQTSSLPTLIDYLNIQMNDVNSYSLCNNVGILKIYLLYPSYFDVLVVQKILIQGLMQLPTSDFTVCVAQIPLHIQSKEPIMKILNLHSLLQSCLFKRFWESSKVPTDFDDNLLVVDVPGLKDSIRRFILDILPLVYLQMTVLELMDTLDYEKCDEDFENMLLSCGWVYDKEAIKDTSSFIQTPREDVSKPVKGSTPSKLDKYLRSDTIQYYLSTLHS